MPEVSCNDFNYLGLGVAEGTAVRVVTGKKREVAEKRNQSLPQTRNRIVIPVPGPKPPPLKTIIFVVVPQIYYCTITLINFVEYICVYMVVSCI